MGLWECQFVSCTCERSPAYFKNRVKFWGFLLFSIAAHIWTLVSSVVDAEKHRTCFKVNNLRYCFVENIPPWCSHRGETDFPLAARFLLVAFQGYKETNGHRGPCPGVYSRGHTCAHTLPSPVWRGLESSVHPPVCTVKRVNSLLLRLPFVALLWNPGHSTQDLCTGRDRLAV